MEETVMNLKKDVVYHVKQNNCANEWLVKHLNDGFSDLESGCWIKRNFSYGEDYTYTIATPIQIKHYEACLEEGLYVEPVKAIAGCHAPKYYDNSKGSLYAFAEHHKLNAYEFEIIKRVIRCRKKGEFISDLEKTKTVIDIYFKEQKDNYKNEIEQLNI